MDIFDDLAQAVRFAYALDAYKQAGGALVLVGMALKDAGVRPPPGLLPERLAELRTQATDILRAVHGLFAVERAAINAAFARDWNERRAATHTLFPYYRHLLARLVDNPKLVDKLVTRHYIAVRERGAGWSLDELSGEFCIPKSKLTRATHALDHCARKLEAMALNSLREALGLPGARKTQDQPQEVAHA